MMPFASRLAAVCAVGVVLAACRAELLSDDRITLAVAEALGAPLTDLRVSGRTEDEAGITHVTARLGNGAVYACSIKGGGLYNLGMTRPPVCGLVPTPR